MTTATAQTYSRAHTNSFFVSFSVFCAVLAFGAFAPTYWLQVPAGTFVGSPLLHLHAVLFSSWVLLLVWQTALAAQGRLKSHRTWGLAGISLATLMVVIGLAVAIDELRIALAAGYGDRARAFLFIPVSAIVLFGGFFCAAIVNVRRPEAHKRLMLLATIALLQAAMGRIFFLIHVGVAPGLRPGLGAPPPLAQGFLPSLCLEILVIVGIIYDWRTRGRPHPAWLFGFVILGVVIFSRPVIALTPGWLATADWLAHFVD